MKRLLCMSVIAVGVLTAVLAGGATAAPADSGLTSYRVSYVDPLFGATSCVGVHLTGKNGTAESGGMDSFFCTISNHLIPGTTYTQADFAWCSDYFAQPAVLGDCVEASSFSITVGGAGLSVVGRAVYP
jgi:hypothetical protein